MLQNIFYSEKIEFKIDFVYWLVYWETSYTSRDTKTEWYVNKDKKGKVPDRVKKERKADEDKTDCRIDKRKGKITERTSERQFDK